MDDIDLPLFMQSFKLEVKKLTCNNESNYILKVKKIASYSYGPQACANSEETVGTETKESVQNKQLSFEYVTIEIWL